MDHRKEESEVSPHDFPLARNERLIERGPACPSAEDWGLYKAGLQPEIRAQELLAHASECDACGVLLADMVEDELVTKFTENSQALPLKSGTSSWMREMAMRLEAKANQAPLRVLHSRRLNWWWAAAAAALITLVVGTSSNSALWLLNQSTPRPFEFRVEGAPYQPLSGSRGTDGTQGPAFLAAKLLIAVRGKLQPDNASWLHARARAAILERGGSSTVDARAVVVRLEEHAKRVVISGADGARLRLRAR